MAEREDASYVLPRFLARWQNDFLAVQSTAFRLLKREQQLGWESKALDAFYNRNSGSAGTAQASTTSSATFFDSNVEGLCERYRKHACAILHRSDASFFDVSQHKNGSETKTFVDMGCAPGGVSAYLALDLKWSGVGVSLPVAEGGIAMTELLSNEKHFTFLGGSILDAQLVHSIRKQFLDNCDAAQRENFAGFDFVNGGAVQDHGQRNHSDCLDGRDGPALPWFYFLVPQLIAALSLVRRDGKGCVMVVYGMSQCGSLMLLVHLLVELKILPSFSHVDFLETMHLTKPPIYMMLRGVAPTDASIEKLKRYFTAPFECSLGACSPADSEGHQSPSNSIATPQSFWQLDHSEEQSAAQAAFANCGRALEHIWTKAEGYLRMRREKAERAVALQRACLTERPKRARDT